MHGLHLTADLYRCHCDDAWLTDAGRIAAWCDAAARAAGLAAGESLACGQPPSPQGPGGVAATLLGGNDHLCLHTWPASRSVTADVFVAGAGADAAIRARGLVDAVVARFQPEWTEQRSLDRGGDEA